MEKAICIVSVAPIRSETSDKSEMVSQLLLGELFTIVEKTGNWLHIKTDYDSYEGYIDYKHAMELTEDEYSNFKIQTAYSKQSIDFATIQEQPFAISIGSELRLLESEKMIWKSVSISFDGETTSGTLPKEGISRTAFAYLNTPYLWGGKSAFGIDCSGFTQQVYKLIGVFLPRDAYQQAEYGEVLSFLEEATQGDLAFFDNDEGKIIHVGIVLEGSKIIHAHGKVRIDYIDNTGIYNSDLGKYTHKLRFVRKIM